MSRREEEDEAIKEMIRAFAKRGVSPKAIKNDSEDCKNQAKKLKNLGATSEELKEEFWACMADKLEGETSREKKSRYFREL